MSRKQPQFPWRVVAISSLLFVVLVVVGWLALVPSEPGTAPQDGDAAENAEGGPPGGPATSPGNPADSNPQAVNSAGTTAIDPTTPEGRAALAASRAEAGTMELKLFLIIAGSERLIPVPAAVAAPATLDAQVERAVRELIGWTGVDTTSPVVPDAGLREVWVSPGGIAYLDFSSTFQDSSRGGSLGELQAVYGIVATLTESFPEIVAVQFLIEGRSVETLSGHVDISRPVLPSDEWVLLERREAPIQQFDGSD